MPRLTKRTPQMYQDRGRAYVKIDGQRIPLGRWDSPYTADQVRKILQYGSTKGRGPLQDAAALYLDAREKAINAMRSGS